MVVSLTNDLRQCSKPSDSCIPFSQLRVQLYKLVSTLCSSLGSNSGVEFVANVLVPLVVADFLPPKAGIKLVSAPKPKSNSKQKNIGGARSGNPEALQQKSSGKDKVALAVASLTCLADIFKSGGVFIRKSLHKNVSCILIGLCTEVQSETKPTGVFGQPGVRFALYNALLEVLISSHPKWPAPVQFAIKIFQKGKLSSSFVLMPYP